MINRSVHCARARMENATAECADASTTQSEYALSDSSSAQSVPSEYAPSESSEMTEAPRYGTRLLCMSLLGRTASVIRSIRLVRNLKTGS